MLYVDVGDGASGESKNPAVRPNPQRLDTMVGKIVRIIPDLNEHTKTSTVSENGRYRIPNDNPFVKTPGARKEIWAYGLRNPHRLTFAVDPSNAANNRLVASICGLNTWEMITIIHKGANYGFPLREGNQAVRLDNTTMPLPADDRIPVLVSDTETAGTTTRSIPSSSGRTTSAAATAPAAVISTTARPFPRFAASSSTTTSRPGASGIPTTRRCSRPTMGIRRRWRRCTK